MTSALAAAKSAAAGIDPLLAAERSGATFEKTDDGGIFTLPLLSKTLQLTHPAFDACFPPDGAVPDRVAALALYYLAKSDGTPPTGVWISFADLPEGRFYCSTWRGYTGQALVRSYGDDVDRLSARARQLGAFDNGLKADLALSFPVLPKVPVCLLYWRGDEEFDARADFLLDASVPHHLSTDSCAVLCKWLTDALCSLAP